MISFEYKVEHMGKTHVFKDLAQAWNYADTYRCPRPPRIKEAKDTHPYLRGPIYWQNNLMFWRSTEPGKKKYSQKEIEYYDNWLSDMFANERINTWIQNGLQ